VIVTWVPRDQPFWGHGDTWSNEFTAADGEELTGEPWSEYYLWSKKTVTGATVFPPEGFDQDFIYIALTEPGPGGRVLVGYPIANE
jgi:hypothetical protein